MAGSGLAPRCPGRPARALKAQPVVEVRPWNPPACSRSSCSGAGKWVGLGGHVEPGEKPVLVTVEYGGWALLAFLTGHGTLGAFRERFLRAGHAHAGVLLVLSLAYFLYLGRAGYSAGVQWLAGSVLLAGVLTQSEGFFLHMERGQEGRSSEGTALSRIGALLIAAALIILAIGLITH
jgi:hypothetical protein